MNVENKTEKKFVRFTKSELKSIEKAADKHNMRFSEFIRFIVREFLKKFKGK